MKMEVWQTALLCCVAFACFGAKFGAVLEPCNSPQYLELGKAGVVNCSFQEEPLRVFWYKSLQTTTDNLLIKLWDSVKTGRGYDSGQYNIYLNGSLKINNVSSEHDGYFTVVKFRSLEYDPKEFAVEVLTIVKPSIRQPLIQGCAPNRTKCFFQSSVVSEVVCYVSMVRPPVSLQWISRTPFGDQNLSTEVTVEHKGITTTTVASTNNTFYFASVLSLLVCKVHSLPQLLDTCETSILLENGDTNFSSLPPIPKFIQRNSKVKLLCSESNVNLIVWKKSSKLTANFQLIFHSALFQQTTDVTHIDGYELSSDGSLIVPNIGVKHEGLYGCTYETDGAGSRSLFNVTVYVPAYPAIAGCTKYQYCTLETEIEGSITCSVIGIRPLVHLKVGTLNKHDSSFIAITDRDVSVSNNDDVYDIRMTMKFRIHKTSPRRLTLACSISGTNIEVLKAATKFDLFLSQEPANHSTSSSLFWILVVLLPLGCLFTFLGRFLLRRDHGRKKETNDKEKSHDDETMPMFPTPANEQHIEEKRNLFIKQLKGKYEDLYNAIQPIPYIRKRLFCVDRVFVEGGLEFLVSSDKKWESLTTYHGIFSNSLVKSTRRILEGGPGYGKSTLTLQFAYDWCNHTSRSPLKDVQILILLRLRQLGGVASIYRAIRKFILPRDSLITEADIKYIISKTSSTVIILDGFDEYPDQDEVDTDIYSIITRQMFQDLEVVLTTRSSCLPHKYSPQTKRVRLTGFDETARLLYLEKAVVENDSVAAGNIIHRLQENTILDDLCQVPLFFVMYAHMSHESNDTLNFRSVTSFFRHIIACFHNHMFNKTEDDNVEKLGLFATAHQKLDRVAFEGLIDKKQKNVWKKEQLQKKIGEDFYNQYIRTGILIEDVSDFDGAPSFDVNDLTNRKTDVRFYHKLFGEWYAAHSLAERAQTLPLWRLRKLLRHVDPFDLQYLYRFACGINPKAAEKIIKHLKETERGDQLAILCILEKTEDMSTIHYIIKELFSSYVTIRNEDTTLLQRSTVQILDIASKNEISISEVYLSNCYSTVNLSGGNHLQLKSNLSLPVLTSLNKLTIDTYGEGIQITAEEFAGILQYSSKCLTLKELELRYCLLPQSLTVESVSVLRSRKVKVYWRPRGITLGHMYQLNLESRLWQQVQYRDDSYHVVGEIADDDYQLAVKEIREAKERR